VIQIAVTYFDDVIRYFPVTTHWRIDNVSRTLVIDCGVPRTHIPLDNIRYWEVQEAEVFQNLN
jgi:hypothetical protein